jgi:ADP-ribose pyrophosphatase
MNAPHPVEVRDIEVVEDFTATARCDEGWLRVRRLRCRNRRADGTTSEIYRVDVVDRPRLDAVAVIVFRRVANDVEVLTRQQLRPAAYFRKDRPKTIEDGRSHLFIEEIVAGLLEPTDHGEEGLRSRAAVEVAEEAGFQVPPAEIVLLGGPYFLAPGIVSEKMFPCAVDVTGKPQAPPSGDGSPLEEGATLRWRTLPELLRACRSGEIQDARTEIGAARLAAHLGLGAGQ